MPHVRKLVLNQIATLTSETPLAGRNPGGSCVKRLAAICLAAVMACAGAAGATAQPVAAWQPEKLARAIEEKADRTSL